MTDNSEQNKESEISSMPFLQHLEELRWRLLKSIIAVIVMSMVAFYFAGDLIKFIKIPFGDTPLYNIQVTGTFYAYLKIALFTGVVGSLPIIFYQLWAFISPGLYRQEKAWILPMVAISTLLFLVGAGFCFLVVLPISFKFLMGFAGEMIQNTITIGSYINFVGLLMLAFGFGFQMPIVAYFLGKIGLITPRFMSKGRRYAIPILLIVGAVITPPDVFTQVLLAAPLYLLYEISIIIVRITQRSRAAEEPAETGSEVSAE
ncbi:MAG: twin-arginine translocase subunit TatC [Candidatus Zixiibacteriota bacterium]|nr:MAG: twin-arginine translocase subunit TatC [candidate division Zixibacteria bacterium]